MNNPTRRDFLTASTGGIAAAVSGCGALPFARSSGTKSRKTGWLPSPGDAGNGAVPRVHGADVAGLREQRDAVAPAEWTAIRMKHVRRPDPLGLGFEQVDRLLAVGGGTVVVGDWPTDAVVDSLVEHGFRAAGEHRGFDVYETGGAAVAVSEGKAVVGADLVWDLSPTAFVRGVVDARTGQENPLASTNEAASRLLDAVEGSHLWAIQGIQTLELRERPWLLDGVNSYPGLVASGSGIELSDGMATLMEHYLFEDEFDAKAATVTPAGRSPRWTPDPDRVTRTATRDGRLLSVATTMPTAELSRGTHPEMRFGYGVDPETPSVTITYESGPSLDGGVLTASVLPRTVRPKSLGATRTTVDPGDRWTVDVPSTDVDVLLTYDAGDLPAVVSVYDVEDRSRMEFDPEDWTT